jgi:putative ubiquitin-RnfH superfamily antitoxin RatB of RatAB toxin-antitoxin module
MAERIRVEVAYARPERQSIVELELPAGATVETALRASRLWEQFPEIDPEQAPVGIFGNLCERDTRLGPGDRVEIYRPLLVDPRMARRQRAARD